MGAHSQNGCDKQHTGCPEKMHIALCTYRCDQLIDPEHKDDHEQVVCDLQMVDGKLQGKKKCGDQSSQEVFPAEGEDHTSHYWSHIGYSKSLAVVPGLNNDKEVRGKCKGKCSQGRKPRVDPQYEQQYEETQEVQEYGACRVGKAQLKGLVYLNEEIAFKDH